MDRGGVGDKRGSKEMDGCPLTMPKLSVMKVTSPFLLYSFTTSHDSCAYGQPNRHDKPPFISSILEHVVFIV
jgi:hypothetical protein